MRAFFAISFFIISNASAADFRCRDGEMDWECANREAAVAERKLNTTYRELLARMTASKNSDQRDARKQLIESQRIWVTFRDADCAAYESYTAPSTSRAALAISCTTEHAKARTEQLKAFDGW
jgi:uncharacterized protein YecT (DUF1311 family)